MENLNNTGIKEGSIMK